MFFNQDLGEVKELLNFPPVELYGMNQERFKKFKLNLSQDAYRTTDDFNDGLYMWRDTDLGVTYVYLDGKPLNQNIAAPGVTAVHLNGKEAPMNIGGVIGLNVISSDTNSINDEGDGIISVSAVGNKNIIIDDTGINAIDSTYISGDGIRVTIADDTDPKNPVYKISCINDLLLVPGTNIKITGPKNEKTISTLGVATKSEIGFVKAGTNIDISDNGTISVDPENIIKIDGATIKKNSSDECYVVVDDKTIVFKDDKLQVPTAKQDVYMSGYKVDDGSLGVVMPDGKTIKQDDDGRISISTAKYDPIFGTFDFVDEEHVPSTESLMAYTNGIKVFDYIEVVDVLDCPNITDIDGEQGKLDPSSTTRGKVYLVPKKNTDGTTSYYNEYTTISLHYGEGSIYFEWLYLGNTQYFPDKYKEEIQELREMYNDLDTRLKNIGA